ncbi:MAG: LysM peptidoglycan-binding domain-containing protein [Opitutae bacterium]|nr:LysM peptidoglycan-binding domain-containing protein [Opitutae bacterium]
MKILQIFGAVVAVHLLAFIFIFASPGCQSSPRNVPTPDATIVAPPSSPPVSFNSGSSLSPVAEPGAPADLGTGGAATTYTPPTAPGRATPTRPGSPNAVAITPPRPVVEEVAPVSTYTVGRGDSLWSIAKKNHLTVSELAKANSLGAGAILQPGRKLIIPGKIGAAKPADLATAPGPTHTVGSAGSRAATAARLPTGESVKHTVQPGESLGTIARKYQVTVGELATANNITDPSKVRAGQQLVIPGFRAVGAKNGAAKNAAAAPHDSASKPAADLTPHFDLKPPPPGQDLDAGLKATGPEVPTIKVEEPKKDAPTPPKG